MGNTVIPLLDWYPTSTLIDGRTSANHFLGSGSIHTQGSRQEITYRFMRYTSQSFLLLLSLIQQKSDNSQDNDSDYDSDNKSCEATFSDL
jgi:hypothetical protein